MPLVNSSFVSDEPDESVPLLNNPITEKYGLNNLITPNPTSEPTSV
jgi:hypothetical protein